MDAEGRPYPKLSMEEIEVFRRSVRLACRVAGSFVEIGIAKATSTVVLLRALAELGEARHVYGIDCWEGPREWHERAAAEFGGACESHYVLGNSRTMDFDSASPIAWVFVDGSHAKTRHVKGDVENWAPRIVPGGVLVMHDSQRVTVADAIRGSSIIGDEFALREESTNWPGIAVFQKKRVLT